MPIIPIYWTLWDEDASHNMCDLVLLWPSSVMLRRKTSYKGKLLYEYIMYIFINCLIFHHYFSRNHAISASPKLKRVYIIKFGCKPYKITFNQILSSYQYLSVSVFILDRNSRNHIRFGLNKCTITCHDRILWYLCKSIAKMNFFTGEFI